MTPFPELLELEVLRPGDVHQIVRKALRRDAPEAVALAAGKDRRGDLLKLGRRKNEHQVLGRLFDNLQKGVEGGEGEHMHLVDDVDAFPGNRGGKHSLLPQVAHVVDTGIGGRIQLDDIQDASVVDAAAIAALVAGVAVYGVFAVHGLGQNPGTGGFARPARADEDVGVGKMPAADLGLQGLGNMLLPDDLVKGLRTPLSVERLIQARSPPSAE